MNVLEHKVFAFIEEHQMLLPGERVVAGISGGADSVCLLFVLLAWKAKYGLDLAVVHINHGIRPEAGEDARFVEALCRREDIPFYLKEADIPECSKQWKCSEEEAGRLFRYQAFEEIAGQRKASKIAVAHNMNDLSETMLFHLFRGTGIKGLCSIAPVREKIIRPLLCVEREEIEAYLKQRGQSYCHDVTNEEDGYTRNRIRHHILTYAQKEIAPGCVQNMNRTAAILSETQAYLEEQTKEALAQCVCESDGHKVVIDCDQFSAYHAAIGKRMILEAFYRILPGARDISSRHVEDIYGLFVKEGNRRICLPHGVEAYRQYKQVTIKKTSDDIENPDPLEGVRAEFLVCAVEDLPRNQENSLIFPQNEYTKWFDYDKIEKSPVVRTRLTGDYLTIKGAGGKLCHKKLKDYMVTEKILPEVRDKCPVLAVDSHVMWLVGYRISEYYKISENTKQVLQVQLTIEPKNKKMEDEHG